MKIFAINLQREQQKKIHIINECNKYSLNVEIINAVDGKGLSEDYLKKRIYNYTKCNITKGEIGCALSHLNIYQKMQDENIPIALILEDDAIFISDPNEILSSLTKNVKQNSKNIYLLSGCLGTYFPQQKLKIDNYIFYKSYETFLAHGYVITKKAAKNILKLQKQVKYEADKWYHFELFGCIKTYCLIPLIIDNNDTNKENSNLEKERGNLIRHNLRHKQMRKLYNRNPIIFLKRKILILKSKIKTIAERHDGLDT